MTTFDKGALLALLAVIAMIILVLIILLIAMKKKEDEQNRVGANAVKMTKLGMPYDDIKNFLPFDDIKDNMIVQEKGERFTMIIECHGINYYLMSEAEKISVEEGFIQFLNSMRFPIQIYVQSRTINLDESIRSYNEKLNKIQTEFNSLLDKFKRLDKQGASQDTILEVAYQLEKKEKVLDYTADLIDNISYLTQNTNVLQKKYYIAVSYHISELGLVNNMAKDELYKVAYNELLNRAETICGGLVSCGIETDILDTYELTEVMYVAVNRDDADIFNIKKIIDSDISSLSITAEDTNKKKQELLKAERRAREIQEEQERMLAEEAERRKYAEMQSAEYFEAQNNYSEPRHSSRNSVDSSTML